MVPGEEGTRTRVSRKQEAYARITRRGPQAGGWAGPREREWGQGTSLAQGEVVNKKHHSETPSQAGHAGEAGWRWQATVATWAIPVVSSQPGLIRTATKAATLARRARPLKGRVGRALGNLVSVY